MDFLANFHILGSAKSQGGTYGFSPIERIDSSNNPRAGYTLATKDPQASASVDISGKALLLSRVFHLDDPSQEPGVEYDVQKSIKGLAPDRNFLTMQDRDALAKIYEYANKKGYDLRVVDELATSWASYRGNPACGTTLSEFQSRGMLDGFDSQTGQFYLPEFSEEDESIAVGILTSKAYALGNSTIPPDVLDSLTDPGRGDAHSADYMKFLGEVAYAFSDTGDEHMENAKAPVRPKDVAAAFLAQLQEKGWDGKSSPVDFLNPIPGVVHGMPASQAEEAQGSLFDQWQGRIKGGLQAWFSDADKDLVGRAYQMVADKGGSDDDWKRMDAAVARLGALRMQQAIAGQLVEAAAGNGDGAGNSQGAQAANADPAYLGILGEMKRLAG